MSEWHEPVARFARANGYEFDGDLAFCTVKAALKGANVKLWISSMGSGGVRGTLVGLAGEVGVVHCKARAKLVAGLPIAVRRKTIFDRLISRGHRMGDPAFDSKYVVTGKRQDVDRLLTGEVLRAFVDMWERSEGLCIDDGDVVLEGGEFSLDPEELASILLARFSRAVADGAPRALRLLDDGGELLASPGLRPRAAPERERRGDPQPEETRKAKQLDTVSTAMHGRPPGEKREDEIQAGDFLRDEGSDLWRSPLIAEAPCARRQASPPFRGVPAQAVGR